jgi:citrate synthase
MSCVGSPPALARCSYYAIHQANLQSISIERIDMLSAPPVRWLTAQEATARLKVSRQTLYSYVGRHHVAVTAAPDDPRRSLYDAADVHRLAERDRMGRSRRAIAASTIRYGEPILASAITRIEDGSFKYRGQDAIALASSATLEDVAALLWQEDSLPQSHSKAVWPRASGATGAAGNCIAALAELAMAGRWAGTTKSVLPDAIRILDQVAWALQVCPAPWFGDRVFRCMRDWPRSGRAGQRPPT